MHWRFLTLATLALLAACTATAEPPQHHASNEGLSLGDQLEPNWNIPTPLECKHVVETRILLAADGEVTGAEPVAPMPEGDPCDVIVQSLRRAAFISSPLWFPDGEVPASVVVKFDPEKFAVFY
jgi:hypothetical protein